MKKILTAILSVTMLFSALTAATAEEAAKERGYHHRWRGRRRIVRSD